MKAMTANIDATYSQAGLEIPTFFIGSDRMDFQAIVSAKGEIARDFENPARPGAGEIRHRLCIRPIHLEKCRHKAARFSARRKGERNL